MPTVPIAAGADDASLIAGEGMFPTSQGGYAGNLAGDIADALFRFVSLDIPVGATVSSAALQITCESASDTTGHTYTIDAADADDATMPTDESEFNAISWTTAKATGNFGDLATGESFTTFDLTAVLQEVIDRAGWASGNAVLFRISNVNTGEFFFFANLEHMTYDPAALVFTLGSAATAGGGVGSAFFNRIGFPRN